MYNPYNYLIQVVGALFIKLLSARLKGLGYVDIPDADYQTPNLAPATCLCILYSFTAKLVLKTVLKLK